MLENIAYLESVYRRYRSDPQSVPAEWRNFFTTDGLGNGHFPMQARNGAAAADARLNEKVFEFVRNHRVRGHRIAGIDPLGAPRDCPPELELEFYDFCPGDLDTPVHVPAAHFKSPLTIRELFNRLRATYCGSIGVQFMHIDDMGIRRWLQQRMESSQNRLHLSRAEQLRILTRLTDAAIFDEFLRKKFPGAKTFSLEGCETLIPLLDLAIEKAGEQEVCDVVIGMAHRGRLNVLANIAGKKPRAIFREFADVEPELWQGRGDVKYHLGHSGEWTTDTGKKIHISLCFNPSHLEFINPIVLGRVRARQDRIGDHDRRRVLSLLIHGDAAFAGEGIIQETLNFSQLAGYSVGGTLHVIVNNQIGFTTAPNEGRSTFYATGIARMLQSPIFHVNGEDPEAVAQVVRLALDFRHEFQRDVFIDMQGYRRWGHNETDEPSFTQPAMYRGIARRTSVREHYLGHLLKSQEVAAAEAEKIARERREKLEQQLADARKEDEAEGERHNEPHGVWRDYTGGPEPEEEPDSGIPAEKIRELLLKLTTVPDGFHLHPKLERSFQLRREMAEGKIPLDWAAAELLALGSLVAQASCRCDEKANKNENETTFETHRQDACATNFRIRLTGQDSARGTFSHRHAILFDHEKGTPFSPLQNSSPEQGLVEIVNSPLSEAGALGFEYGYSLDCPGGLILWEAQFGDFVNAAQVIVDQFISSAEDKWQRLSGLVLLLPHGFEGMGPEHSSARLERFLTLAAEDNIQVAQPTTPAQYFHLLRRQAMRRWRKPLVVLTPKSLLRNARVVSEVKEFCGGNFQRILADHLDAGSVKRILLCSGKIYYELLAHREEQKRNDVAIIRLEQLYPLRAAALEQILQPYAKTVPALWVQEEPANMGAWRYLHEKFGRHLFGRWPFAVVARAESASPATGSANAHKLEQRQLIERAFSHHHT
jgi:2-oxoglutarate dehydrogenase E1 component